MSKALPVHELNFDEHAVQSVGMTEAYDEKQHDDCLPLPPPSSCASACLLRTLTVYLGKLHLTTQLSPHKNHRCSAELQ